MHNATAETGDRSHERTPSSQNQITLATLLVVVAAIAAECALVVEIRKSYAAIPPSAAPVCPEVYATPVVLLMSQKCESWFLIKPYQSDIRVRRQLGNLELFGVKQRSFACLRRISARRRGSFTGLFGRVLPVARSGVN
jgi:hypothetical protein